MTGSALLPQPVPAGHSGPARLLTAPPPRGAGPASAARPSRGCLRLRGDRARAEAYIRPGPSRAKARVLRADIGGGFRSGTRRARGAGHGSRRVAPSLCAAPLPLSGRSCPRSQASHLHPPALQSPQGSRQSGRRRSERRSPQRAREAILLPVAIFISPSERRPEVQRGPATCRAAREGREGPTPPAPRPPVPQTVGGVGTCPPEEPSSPMGP